MKLTLAAAALATAIAGCAPVAAVLGPAGSPFTLDSAAKVQTGMTKQQVIDLRGQPSQQTARVGDEVWTWANYNMATQQSRVATIIFVNGLTQAAPEQQHTY